MQVMKDFVFLLAVVCVRCKFVDAMLRSAPRFHGFFFLLREVHCIERYFLWVNHQYWSWPMLKTSEKPEWYANLDFFKKNFSTSHFKHLFLKSLDSISCHSTICSVRKMVEWQLILWRTHLAARDNRDETIEKKSEASRCVCQQFVFHFYGIKLLCLYIIWIQKFFALISVAVCVKSARIKRIFVVVCSVNSTFSLHLFGDNTVITAIDERVLMQKDRVLHDL